MHQLRCGVIHPHVPRVRSVRNQRTFRVKGRGVSPERGRSGDLLVTVQVAVPSKVSKDEKKLLEELATMETDDVRSHLR